MHTDGELDAFAAWERAAWETRAAPYDASLVALTGPCAPHLLDAAAVGAGSRLVDVATGPGVVALAALERGADVVAVDQSAAMVALAAQRLPDVRQAPAEALPLPDGAADALTAGFLLNHLARPGTAVREAVRVLRPGGRCAFSVWDVPERNAALGLFGPVAAALGIVADAPAGPDPAAFADEAAFRALLGELDDVHVQRCTWSLRVDPGAWLDAVGAATPRTGAVVAAAGARLPELREAFVEHARRLHGTGDGAVELPVAAVVGSGARR